MKFLYNVRRVALSLLTLAVAAAADLSAGIVAQLPTIRVNGKTLYYYDAQSGDNIYSIAEKLGVTVEDIRANNPGVADGVKPRMRLFFPTSLAKENTDAVPAATGASAPADDITPAIHVVQKGESVYGISRKYSMSVDELMALNPAAADGLRSGMRLRLKGSTAKVSPETEKAVIKAAEKKIEKSSPSYKAQANATVAATAPVGPLTEAQSAPAGETLKEVISATDTLFAPVRPDALNIALLLPFQLNESSMSRATQLYTEFYKGFLLAGANENDPNEVPVKIHAYDTEGSTDSVRSIMHRPEMAHMNLIIAPDSPTQLHEIVAGADPYTRIINVFAVKDDSYLTDGNVIQINTPHDRMYEGAIKGFLDKFPSATPVFLEREDGRADKKEFTQALQKALTEAGRTWQTVTFNHYLTDDDLEALDPNSQSYVLIPESGSSDEFNRIRQSLRNFKERAVLEPSAVQLFGYPEWATFRGEHYTDICDITSTIYSRYFPTDHDTAAHMVNNSFRSTYGEGLMSRQMPVLGILGYDTGLMAIKALREHADTGRYPTDYNGIQSGIRLEQAPDGGGYYNNAIFIITYNPGGYLEKTIK